MNYISYKEAKVILENSLQKGKVDLTKEFIGFEKVMEPHDFGSLRFEYIGKFDPHKINDGKIIAYNSQNEESEFVERFTLDCNNLKNKGYVGCYINS